MTMNDGAVAPRPDFAGIQALLSRSPGYSVAQKCVEVQHEQEKLEPSLASSRRRRLHAKAWSWYMGALGEIAVGELLAQLGPEWFVRHAVPIGDGVKDIDHLLIGPSGVYAINTKHHLGSRVVVGDHVVWVNGGTEHYQKAAQRDGLAAVERLTEKAGFPVPVTSLVAIHGESRFARKQTKPATTPVMSSRHLLEWLSTRPVSPLGATRLDLARLAAEEPDTWHVDPRAADTVRVMQRFERLRAAIGEAPARDSVPVSSAPARRASTRASSVSSRPARTAHPRATRSGGRRRPSGAERMLNRLVSGALALGVAWFLLYVVVPSLQGAP